MANEGSTKPTYSELEAELLRVRGLLQRVGQAARNDRNGDRIEKILELIEQGAESADIGKLDRVDKCCSGTTAHNVSCPTIAGEPFEKPAEGEWVQPIESGYRMRCCDCKLTHRMDFRVYEGRAQFRVFREDAGSAETGGEKAAPQNEDKLASGVRGYAPESIQQRIEAAVNRTEIPRDLEHLSELYAASFMDSFPVKVPEEHRLGLVKVFDAHQRRVIELLATSRQSSSLSESGAESVQPEKINAADKSGASPELLPTQLPKADF